MALVGDLKDLPLADIVQINCIGRNTARLLVHYEIGDAIFYFQEGEIFDVRLGELSGDDAIYEALKFNEGAFRIDAGVVAPHRTIFKPWAELLMDGMRRLDEMNAGATGENAEEHPGNSLLDSFALAAEERLRTTTEFSLGSDKDLVGKVINDKYQLDSKIKEGELGTMYRATHLQMDADVAIKVMHPHLVNDQATIERFRRGAHAAARIHHPNAISVLDFGITRENIVYLAMEYLQGETLRQRINSQGRIKPADLAKILRQVCAALEAAHKEKIIHRDIKPENVMLHESGGEELVKVLDFGIAKLKALGQAGVLTAHGLVMGTHSYMSPELCEGTDIDQRSDIYSLGIVAYEALTGSLPFIAPTPVSVALKHIGETPQSMCKVCPDISESIDRVVLRALEKKPQDRQSSALQFAKEFEEALSSKPKVSIKSTIPTPRPSVSTSSGKHINFDELSPNEQFATRGIPEITAGELGEARSRLPKPFDVLYDPVLSRSTNGNNQANAMVPGLVELPPPLKTPFEDSAQMELPTEPKEINPGILTILLHSNKFLFVLSAIIALIILLGSILTWHYFRARTARRSADLPSKIMGTAAGSSEMALIPSGTFQMGRNAAEEVWFDETPAHTVSVAAFYLGLREVTNKEYQAFVKATNVLRPPKGWSGIDFPLGRENFPVTNVSWRDAIAYCQWLSKVKGENYRLPTEEEWEFAARSTDNRLYPWGDIANGALTVSAENPNAKLAAVTSEVLLTDKGPFGILAMAGNVSEWTDSSYKLYPGSTDTLDPKCETSPCRIYRGGNFKSPLRQLTTTYRNWHEENFSDETLGFRIAKDAK